MIHARLCSRRLWRDPGSCPARRGRRSGRWRRGRPDRNSCRQSQSDRLQDRAWRPQARLEIRPAAALRVRCQRRRAVDGIARHEVQAGRRGLCAGLARYYRQLRRTDRAAGKIRGLEAGGDLACGSRFAAAGGTDHAAGIWPRRCPRRPAHPDPRRRRRHRHLRGSIRKAPRPSRHHDHEFEERRLRQGAGRRQDHCL